MTILLVLIAISFLFHYARNEKLRAFTNRSVFWLAALVCSLTWLMTGPFALLLIPLTLIGFGFIHSKLWPTLEQQYNNELAARNREALKSRYASKKVS